MKHRQLSPTWILNIDSLLDQQTAYPGEEFWIPLIENHMLGSGVLVSLDRNKHPFLPY